MGQIQMMKKILRVLAPLLVLAVGFGTVQAMIAAKAPPEKKEETQRLVSLQIEEVRAATVTLSVRTEGEARPTTEIDLVPQVSGLITSIADQFAEGAEFQAGATLIRIDDANYKLALTRAQANVAEAEVKLAQEKAAASIKRRQWEAVSSGSTPSPLQVNQPQVLEAEAKLRSAQATLGEAQLDLARTHIKAPFKGRVRNKSGGLGQLVTTGTALGRIFSTEKMEVRLPLTDTQLMELKLPIGFVATNDNAPLVEISTTVGNQEHVWQGRIVRTLAAVDSETRLVYAIAEVIDPYEGASPLAAGMFVSAKIEGVTPQEVLVVPRSALRSADKVYVVNAEDKLEIRTVDVLSTTRSEVLVSTGITPGERVVTSTIASAIDGMAVNPIEQLAHNE